MADTKKSAEAFSTCLENSRFAAEMQKMMHGQGIGSLCAEMMKKAGRSAGGCPSYCVEMMQGIMKEFSGAGPGNGETKKEEDHAGNK